MRNARLLTGTLATGLALTVVGCVQRVEIVPGNRGPGVAPTLVLEQFLRASNAAAANDTSGVRVMGKLFGTSAGPINGVDESATVEQRMFLIASILKHDDYRILGEQLVPGRLSNARQLNVELVMGPRKVTVPFTLVRSGRESWLVENIELENITARR